MLRRVLILAAALSLFGCTPEGTPAEEIVANMSELIGKRIKVRGKFKSGARCRIGDEDGEWRTYCGKDKCQYCRGPLVLDVGTSTRALDWPMVLAGTWEYKEVRCKGPLGNIECHPLEPGKEYIVQGVLEAYKPPRLLLEKFWPVEKKP